MAKVVIGDLVTKLTADTSSFDSNLIASRKEIKEAKQAIHKLRDPMEQYEHDLKKAESLLKFGEQGQELYNRSIAKARKRYRDLTGETKKAAKAEERLNADRKLANRIIDRQTTKLERLEREQRDLNRLHRQGMVNARQYRHEMERLTREMREANQEASLFSRIGQRIGDSFGLGDIFGSKGSSAIGQVALIGAGIELAQRYFELMQRGAEFAVERLNADREAIDQLAKSADAIGIDIEKLTAFQFAIGQNSGIADEKVIKLFEELTKRSSEAAQGLGESRLAFEEIGLSAAELNKLSPDQRLLKIADAIKGVKDQSDRFRIAGKLFGEEQARVVLTLEQGSDAIQSMLDRADELNLTISKVDAEKVQGMNDAIDAFQRSLVGLSRVLTVEVADELEEMFELSTEIVHTLLENKELLLGVFDNTVVDKIRMVNEVLSLVDTNLRNIERAIERLDSVLKDSGLSYFLSQISGIDLEVGDFVRGALGLAEDLPSDAERANRIEAQTSVDPAESIAAGSREAFNIEFRAEVASQMDIAREQLEVARANAEANQLVAFNMQRVAENLTEAEI